MSKYSRSEILNAANQIGVDWSAARFNLDDLVEGVRVELEHGTANDRTNVTNDDLIPTLKIALAHLYEDNGEHFDYYDGLKVVEQSPSGHWRNRASTYWRNYNVRKYIMYLLLAIAVIALLYTFVIGGNIPTVYHQTAHFIVVGILALLIWLQ